MSHFVRQQIWKRNNPSVALHKMSNEEKWIGKIVPANLDWKETCRYAECDECGKLFHVDDLHTFGACHGDNMEIDWDILKVLHWDYAQGACDHCLNQLEMEMEKLLKEVK